MDYEFVFDDFAKPVAIFSIGHEAIACWFNEELDSLQTINHLLGTLIRLEERVISQHHIQGREFQLRLSNDSAEVVANSLGFEVYEALPENTELYDQELQAECGLIDFKQALIGWQTFISEKLNKTASY